MQATYYSKSSNLLIPWELIYPECTILRKDNPRSFAAMCFRHSCPNMAGCPEVIAKRIAYWFDFLEPTAKAIFAYFKVDNSVGVVYFSKDMGEPKLTYPANRSGFKELINSSTLKKLVLTQDYINIHKVYKTSQIIPVTNLIK